MPGGSTITQRKASSRPCDEPGPEPARPVQRRAGEQEQRRPVTGHLVVQSHVQSSSADPTPRARPPRMRTCVRVRRGHDPPRRPRLLLRVGGAARPSAPAQPRGHRRRRGRARRELRGQGVRRARPRWAAGRRCGCARTRSSCGRAWRRTPRPAAPSSAVFEDTTPLVEGLSVDEAFLDVRGMERIAGTPEQIAVRLRRAVHEQVGLPITVGIARTKFLAKVASGVAKPDGLLVVPPDGELDFLHPLPVERLWGVGAEDGRAAARPRPLDRGRRRRAVRGRAGLDARARRRPAAARPRPQPRPAPGRRRQAARLDGRPARPRPRAAQPRRGRRRRWSPSSTA